MWVAEGFWAPGWWTRGPSSQLGWLPAMELGPSSVPTGGTRGLRLQPLPSRPGISNSQTCCFPTSRKEAPLLLLCTPRPPPRPRLSSSDDAAHQAWCPVSTAGGETCSVGFGCVVDSPSVWGGSALIFLLLSLRWSQVIRGLLWFLVSLPVLLSELQVFHMRS